MLVTMKVRLVLLLVLCFKEAVLEKTKEKKDVTIDFDLLSDQSKCSTSTKKIDVREGQNLTVSVKSNVYINYITCSVYNKQKLVKPSPFNLSEPKSEKPYRFHPSQVINKEHTGQWECLLYLLRDTSALNESTVTIKNHTFHRRICAAAVKVTDTDAITDNLIIIFSIISVLAAVILIQFAFIIYFKRKARRTAGLETLSMKYRNKDTRDPKRYSATPGSRNRKTLSISKLLTKGDSKDDIYETLEEIKASLVPPTPPIETIPTLKKDISKRPPMPIPEQENYEEPAIVAERDFPRAQLPLPLTPLTPQKPNEESLPGTLRKERSRPPSPVKDIPVATPTKPIAAKPKPELPGTLRKESTHSKPKTELPGTLRKESTPNKPIAGTCVTPAPIMNELLNYHRRQTGTTGAKPALKQPPKEKEEEKVKKSFFGNIKKDPNRSTSMTQPSSPRDVAERPSLPNIQRKPSTPSKPDVVPKPDVLKPKPQTKPSIVPKPAVSPSTKPALNKAPTSKPTGPTPKPAPAPVPEEPPVPKPTTLPRPGVPNNSLPHTGTLPKSLKTAPLPPLPAPVPEVLQSHHGQAPTAGKPPMPSPDRFHAPPLPEENPVPVPKPPIQEPIYEAYDEEPLYNSDEDWTYEPLPHYNIYSS